MIELHSPIQLKDLTKGLPDLVPICGQRDGYGLTYVRGFAARDELITLEAPQSLNSQRDERLLCFSTSYERGLGQLKDSVVVIPMSFESERKCIDALVENGNVVLASSNPRLVMIRLLQRAASSLKPQEYLIQGKNCRIKPGVILGEEGFGFERDEQGRPLRFPHFGRVVLGDEVEVGANTVVSRGALSDTTIGAYTKIDDLVYIAHNCQIGERVMIAGGAKLCGGVTVGKDAWIGAGACIKQNIQIGAGAVIGMGAVVISDVPAFATVAGNPARILEQSKPESESESKSDSIPKPVIAPPHNQRQKGSKACAG